MALPDSVGPLEGLHGTTQPSRHASQPGHKWCKDLKAGNVWHVTNSSLKKKLFKINDFSLGILATSSELVLL